SSRRRHTRFSRDWSSDVCSSDLEVKTEDELAGIFQIDTLKSNPKIGKYESLYVGYSKEYRKTSSSGGLATYFLAELFENKIVERSEERRVGKECRNRRGPTDARE